MQYSISVRRFMHECTNRLLTRVLVAVLASLPMLATTQAQTSTYPDKPLQLVIPFPAGGPADIVGRLYAQHLSTILGQPVVVENPAGAGGTIGTRTVAKSEPNGRTLLFGTTSTMAINQLIMKNLPYDFEKDFTVLGLIANAPHVLAVRANLPYKDVNELVAAAKKEPNKYTFASSGIGTIVQMGGELFRSEAGIDLLHVPFKGGNPATQALLSGDVDMTVNDMTTLKSFVIDGRLRPLAVAHTERLALLPDTPTFKEVGLPNVVSSTWWGLAVPTETPADIQKVLKEAHNKIIHDPAYKARLEAMAVETFVLSDAEINQFMKGEVDKWSRIVEFANITPN